MGMAGVGYFIFLISAFVFPSQYIFAIGFTLLFYGLYFGVLSRDIVDYIVEKMSVTIGVSFNCSFESKKTLNFLVLLDRWFAQKESTKQSMCYLW